MQEGPRGPRQGNPGAGQGDAGHRSHDGHAGRGPPHTSGAAPPGRYEKIAAMRRESHAAMLKRQVAQLELSDRLAGAETMQASAAILAGGPEVVNTSSWQELPWAPRSYLHSVMAAAGDAPAAAAAPAPDRGSVQAHLAAMEAAMTVYTEHAPKDRTIRSKRGSFVVRPEQAALIGGPPG